MSAAPALTAPSERRASSNRARVVHVAARLPVGGMENVVIDLYRRLPADRYETEVWCLEDPDVQGRELIAAGERIEHLHKRPGRDPGLFLRLASLMRHHQPAVVHCHDELSWFYVGGAASLARGGTRVVMTAHGRRAGISGRHLLEQRLLARRSHRIVAVSEYLRSQLESELRPPIGRVVTIRNGVSIQSTPSQASARASARLRLGLPSDGLVVGTVAELSRVKNLRLLIDAFAWARVVVPSLRMVIVGDGALRGELEERAATLGQRDRVLFAGLRRDVIDLLPAVDIYACSSDYEGISLSILEALAAARPVVATNVGGNPELVRDGITGRLTPAGNVKAFARLLAELAQDASQRARLGQEGREYVTRTFAMDRMIDAYDRLYRSLGLPCSAGL